MCKACKSECPLGVDMATLKSETLPTTTTCTARRCGPGSSARSARSTGSARRPRRCRTCPAGCPRCAADGPRARHRAAAAACRCSSGERCPAGSGRPACRERQPTQGPVTFLADSFTSFTEPAVGQAAIELLERAGWEVRLEDSRLLRPRQPVQGPARRGEDGRRPAWSTRSAATSGPDRRACEPSCLLTLRDEHRALLPDDPRVARRRRPGPAGRGAARRGDRRRAAGAARGRLAGRPADPLPRALPPEGRGRHRRDGGAAAAHPGRRGGRAGRRVLRDGRVVRVRGRALRGVDGRSARTGCSRPSAPSPTDTVVAATGVSCRQQIAHGTTRRAHHPVELIRAALTPWALRSHSAVRDGVSTALRLRSAGYRSASHA